jgi:hypothetical protein
MAKMTKMALEFAKLAAVAKFGAKPAPCFGAVLRIVRQCRRLQEGKVGSGGGGGGGGGGSGKGDKGGMAAATAAAAATTATAEALAGGYRTLNLHCAGCEKAELGWLESGQSSSTAAWADVEGGSRWMFTKEKRVRQLSLATY